MYTKHIIPHTCYYTHLKRTHPFNHPPTPHNLYYTKCTCGIINHSPPLPHILTPNPYITFPSQRYITYIVPIVIASAWMKTLYGVCTPHATHCIITSKKKEHLQKKTPTVYNKKPARRIYKTLNIVVLCGGWLMLKSSGRLSTPPSSFYMPQATHNTPIRACCAFLWIHTRMCARIKCADRFSKCSQSIWSNEEIKKINTATHKRRQVMGREYIIQI